MSALACSLASDDSVIVLVSELVMLNCCIVCNDAANFYIETYTKTIT